MSEQFVVGGGVGVPLTIWGARRLMCFDGLNLFVIMQKHRCQHKCKISE